MCAAHYILEPCGVFIPAVSSFYSSVSANPNNRLQPAFGGHRHASYLFRSYGPYIRKKRFIRTFFPHIANPPPHGATRCPAPLSAPCPAGTLAAGVAFLSGAGVHSLFCVGAAPLGWHSALSLRRAAAFSLWLVARSECWAAQPHHGVHGGPWLRLSPNSCSRSPSPGSLPVPRQPLCRAGLRPDA